MRKIFMAVMLGAALAGCGPYAGYQEPVPANGPTTLTPQYSTQDPPNVEVTIYKDPGRCQYLVFNDLGSYGTISVVPRMDDEFRGACISSDTP
jgi:hypothetical protein